MIKNMDEMLSAATKASKEQLGGYSCSKKEVELIGTGKLEAEEVGWLSGSSSAYTRKMVSDWNSRDMLSYCFFKYKSLTGNNWSISYAGAQESLKLTQEEIKKLIGEWPSNKLTKFYIDWFFREKAEEFIASNSFLSFKMLRYGNVVHDFIRFCQKENLSFKTKEKITDKTICQTSEECMSASMKNGINHFLLNYGIFICYQWLKNKENYDKKTSIKKISQSVIEYMTKESVDELFALSEKLGPYPSDMKQEFTELTEQLAKDTGEPFTLLTVEYKDEQSRFPFFS